MATPLRKEIMMLKLIRDCAPWLSWRVGAGFVGVVLVVLFAFGGQAGLLAFVGATPLLGLALCLVPCLIPLLLLRGKGRKSAADSPADTAQAGDGRGRG